jgi:hypothetical protein
MRSLIRWVRVQPSLIGRHRKRRRFLGAGAVVAATAFAVFMITNALAVHDEKFELDGNVTTQGETAFQKGTVDWESFFNSAGEKLTLPTGFTASGFTRDFKSSGTKFVTSDPSTYTTGSKDTLPISTGWECTSAPNVNSKDDIMNAYAAAYTNAAGEEFLYFGLERNANTGNANVGVWFLQNKVSCEPKKEKETIPFTGDHATGDLLIVSEFTNGGGVSTINVYQWEGGPTGKLNPDPVAKGADCTSKTQEAKDTICATTNGSPEGINGPITTPWLTANKEDGVGHKLQASEFYEGGVNLTKAKLGERCFNVFVQDTRSSQSLTATLFDFSRGELGECASETKTTPVQSDGKTTIPPAGLEIPASGTLEVKDQAEVKVKGTKEFKGTVSFHLCGPFSSSSTTLCGSGGVAVGEPVSVTSNTTVTSGGATITKAGRYCWRADFSGDESKGVPGSSDSAATECFLIKPRPTTLTTKAGTTPVKLGTAITDTASLTGTANEPGSEGPEGSTDGSINPKKAGKKAQGTITFTLTGPDKTGSTTNCNKLAAGFAEEHPEGIKVSVNGDNTYGPVSFKPTVPGVYHWKASYGGDLPNTEGSSHNAACNDTAEDVVVEQETTTTTTRQFVYPQDKAKVVSEKAAALSGELTFKLYDSKANCEANGTTGLKFKEGPIAVSGTSPQLKATKNTSFLVSAETLTTLYWNVQYKSNSESQLNSSSECTETTSVTFTGNDGSIEVP